MGVFCLKSSIFNLQFLKDIPEEYEGESGRKNTSEYSKVKQKFPLKSPYKDIAISGRQTQRCKENCGKWMQLN